MLRFSRYALTLSSRAGFRRLPADIRWVSRAANPEVRIAASQPLAAPRPQIRLRDYQEECIQAVLSYLDAGHKRLGVSLATGSGKTVIFTHLIDRLPALGSASQTLILAHRRELVEQAARHCSVAYPDKHVDIEMGSNQASGVADITVASIQSITSGHRLHKFDPSRYKLVLVDEAHHIVSQTYLKVLEHFGLRHSTDWNEAVAPALVGVSATFSRFDGRALGAVIDHIVYHRDYVDMIEEKWLSDVVFTTVELKTDLTKVASAANGDFQAAALSKAINTDETNDLVVKTWFAKAQGRDSTLVFCVDLSHVTSLTARFRASGIDAQFVTGDTPPRIRCTRIEAFRDGAFPVLLNCGVFTEGTDIPNIDCVLLARPTKSRNLLVQMIGRGMRLHQGKANCHVIDMVAALSSGVVSTPTLFGLDSAEIIEYANAKSLSTLQARKETERRHEEAAAGSGTKIVARKLPGDVTFTDYDSVHDLIADTSSDGFIRNLSPYAWVGVGEGKFVLTTNSGNYLSIEPSNDQGSFRAKYYWRLPPDRKVKSPYGTPRIIAQADTFEHVVHAADTYASEAFEHMWIAKSQPWRRSRASQAQVDFLNKFRPHQNLLKPEDLTKGKAGDMITRLKHGAKGRYEKATVKQKGEARIRQRAETIRERLQSQVKVGPLQQQDSALKKEMLD